MVEQYERFADWLSGRYFRVSARAILSREDLKQAAMLALVQAMRSKPENESYILQAMKFAVWAENDRAFRSYLKHNLATDGYREGFQTTPGLAVDIDRIVPTLTEAETAYFERVIVEGRTASREFEKSKADRLRKAIIRKFACLAA